MPNGANWAKRTHLLNTLSSPPAYTLIFKEEIFYSTVCMSAIEEPHFESELHQFLLSCICLKDIADNYVITQHAMNKSIKNK